MKRLRGRLTYANVISSVALFLVLAGGTAYARHEALLAKNSVGTKQLKRGAVTPAKLSAAAKDTLTGAPGPAGATGTPGATGPSGAQGPEGPPASNAGGSTDLLRTTEFNEVLAAPYPTGSELASLTFTPPESGKVLVQGRGECEVPTTTTSYEEAVLIFAENSWEEAIGRLRERGPAEDGLAEVPAQSAVSQNFDLGWSAQTILTVVGGEATTTRLFGETFPGEGSVSSRCFGTITVTGMFG